VKIDANLIKAGQYQRAPLLGQNVTFTKIPRSNMSVLATSSKFTTHPQAAFVHMFKAI
jgi:hypothetical protein